MPKYYAVGGVIDLRKPKTNFWSRIEGYYHKISYEFLTHILYQNMRSRCGSSPDNQKISRIYLFQTLKDATAFSNCRENKAYNDNSVALSPIFSIDTTKNFKFQSSQLVDMPLATYPSAAEIHLIEENQLDSFLQQAIYKNSYVAVKKEPLNQSKIFYVHENGKYQKVPINDMKKFWQQYDPIYTRNQRAFLSWAQVDTLITQNGGHIPDYSYKKEAEKIQKEVSWFEVDSSDFDEFRRTCTIGEIYLPGYVKNDQRMYYEEHIACEANRSLFDLNWWLVLAFTFWTVVIPIGYTIGRLWNQYYAKTILQKIEQSKGFDPLTREQWISVDEEYSHYIQKFESAVVLEESTSEKESLLSNRPFHAPNNEAMDISENLFQSTIRNGLTIT